MTKLPKRKECPLLKIVSWQRVFCVSFPRRISSFRTVRIANIIEEYFR